MQNTRLPQLSIANFQLKFCTKCSQEKTCITFNCNHSYCDFCLWTYYRFIVKNLQLVVFTTPEVLNGTGSNLGCPKLCKVSELSIPSEWLLQLFLNFEESEFTEILEKSAMFFSGIPSYFEKCKKCGELCISVVEKTHC